MRLWTRIFLLCTILSVLAVAAVGFVFLRAGTRSLVEGEARSLGREARQIADFLDHSFQTVRAVEEQLPDGSLLPMGTTQSVYRFLEGTGGSLLTPFLEMEIAGDSETLLYVAGSRFLQLGPRTRPEFGAAAAGKPSFVLRRMDGKPVLFLSAATTVGGERIVMSVCSVLDALDVFQRRQSGIMISASAILALFLAGASFIGSRAIARRIQNLTAGVESLGEGDWTSRVAVEGRDEVGRLASRFNGMADRIQAAVGQLSEEKEDRQRFIDSLTHELRTPLTSIVGFAGHLRGAVYDPAVFDKALARIHDEGMRMLDLSEGLKRLLLSRAAGAQTQPIAVEDLLAEVASEANDRLAGSPVRVEPPVADASVYGDRVLLKTALLNLVENAAAASPAGSPVEIGFVDESGGRAFLVRDHGKGMDPGLLARIGEPFLRDGKRRDGAGMGLGLAICRQIAESHGARLELECPQEGGTVARILFPNLQDRYNPETRP